MINSLPIKLFLNLFMIFIMTSFFLGLMILFIFTYIFLSLIYFVNNKKFASFHHICMVSPALFLYLSKAKKIFCLTTNNSHFACIVMLLLLISFGCIETDPGPNTGTRTLSFAVWNLDSLPARNFARIPFIESLQDLYKFDFFAVCESSLNDSISNDDIHVHSFSPDPFRADKIAGAHNGGVCLYYKEDLPIKRRSDLELLSETIVVEILLKNKKKYFLLYHIDILIHLLRKQISIFHPLILF